MTIIKCKLKGTLGRQILRFSSEDCCEKSYKYYYIYLNANEPLEGILEARF